MCRITLSPGAMNKKLTTSFIHYDFLSGLPYKTIPYLDKTKEELAEINSYQENLFRFAMVYMSLEKYYEKIKSGKEEFKTYWEEKSFQSWNYAGYAAYYRLK